MLRRRTRGFSFTEIMFAVIILGVGFIMVAAIFPVAIQQAKSTTEETTAAAIARGTATYVGSVLSDNVAGTGTTNCAANAASFTNGSTITRVGIVQQPTLNTNPSMWDSVLGNLVLPEDRRYGCVFLWSRNVESDNTPSPYVQLYLFPVQARNTTTFDQSDVNIAGNANAKRNLTAWPPPPANPLTLSPLKATVYDSTINTPPAGFSQLPLTDVVTFDSTSDVTNHSERAAVEGAYVVVASFNPYTANNINHVGDVYRLGAQRLDVDPSGLTWDLQPGNDYTPGAGGAATLSNAQVYLIGKGNTNPNGTAAPTFDGPAMPISYYTTFVKVN